MADLSSNDVTKQLGHLMEPLEEDENWEPKHIAKVAARALNELDRQRAEIERLSAQLRDCESLLRSYDPKNECGYWQRTLPPDETTDDDLSWQTQCDKCGNKSCLGKGRNMKCPCGGVCRDLPENG